MTSPAFKLLSLVLVCSTIGTTSEQTADHGNTHTNMKAMRTSHDMYNEMYSNENIDLRTNINRKYVSIDENNGEMKTNNDANDKFDDIYNENDDVLTRNLDVHRMNLKRFDEMKSVRKFNDADVKSEGRVKRDAEDDRCDGFIYNKDDPNRIIHPHPRNESNYYKNSNCVTVINATAGKVIELTFIDVFHIEYHPDCEYDYLEIRDGLHGYSKLLNKVCGEAFPRQIITSGPHAWLKFYSDDTIEYQGFHINVNFKDAPSHSIPESCYKEIVGDSGVIDSSEIDPKCLSGSADQDLDVLWTIRTPADRKIYLNFTKYNLAKPNECEVNVIEVYGAVLELSSNLVRYCGSVSNPVTTKGDGKGGKDDNGNIMHVRLFASKAAKDTSFIARFTAFRTLFPNNDDKCTSEEFDCDDNTCISIALKCNNYADCRLKTDEEEVCKDEAESVISQPHILVILVIFSLILSGMSFIFLFKCIRKLYQDHKIIKEHIRQSCEDRLDSLVESRLTLDAKRLQRDSEPRASLERENHTNEMYKQQRNFSKRKPTSIDSDFIQETHLDLDEEPWRREVDSVPIGPEEVRIERNGRTRRSDLSKKEESIRSRLRESEENRAKKEIRDVSVGAPDTKESGCQTRESLFQAEPPPSSDGSGSNSRGFSTFGYSGATIARPSTPGTTNASEITIELLTQVPRKDSVKPQKKIPDRRPMSTETTRSAPDVIIVSKPIR